MYRSRPIPHDALAFSAPLVEEAST